MLPWLLELSDLPTAWWELPNKNGSRAPGAVPVRPQNLPVRPQNLQNQSGWTAKTRTRSFPHPDGGRLWKLVLMPCPVASAHGLPQIADECPRFAERDRLVETLARVLVGGGASWEDSEPAVVFIMSHPRVVRRRPAPVPASSPTRATGYGS
ncbi:hypothetical protein FB45DRAFT_870237 [Roridomyces roridus]|uniref:Uncharacterized protein n=1 Tax=Roridomyces roridus TaxID=1738132 RepID=A0AAD7FJK6_9AGAR|nr:hypothetical protein FB45DRAFT_870237 [Roridomyces roridus]